MLVLKRKYYRCNYTVDGIEKKDSGEDDEPMDLEGFTAPEMTEDEKKPKSIYMTFDEDR